MVFSNFFELIKEDEIILKHNDHAQTIHSSIVNTSDASTPIPFG